ncbi:RAMP superfamily CRISPR-associated protein [Candidatus Borrarchaeum sp.]|uniref:RAMP superfamily CRISPR-associated protein n=1 Tax=Candidatus Borrarchaeum sp. TaxID=2846742 RepID=UPI00257ACA6C|nr:RAMP superfamily CRISPR-associated protein [Candidatus Borrarchaeum sp.]
MRKTKKLMMIHAYTPIAKPINTSVQKNSTMLLLGQIPYENGSKIFTTKLYYIKGLRGMLRHACMSLAQDCSIEVCHTSEKTELKDGTKVTPSGFHPLGECEPPCILKRIFGTFREESSISVLSDPIASIKHKEFTTEVPVQKVHIASEYRIAKSFTGIPIQDFKESYFSGYFSFCIDVTELTDYEIKFLMESLLYIETLGAGKRSGYGRIKIISFEFQKVEITRKIDRENGSYKVVENESITPLELDDIESWRDSIPSWTQGTQDGMLPVLNE